MVTTAFEKNRPADLSFLRTLCDCFGPTGCESEVAERIEQELCRLNLPYCRDRMGNLICRVSLGNGGENRPRMMISSHMDEVGFMITEITSDGYLRFGTVGGIDDSVLAGKKVTVRAADGTLLHGIIASKAVHHKTREERSKAVKCEKLYIDIGALTKEDAEKKVAAGDYATFDSEFFLFGADGETVKAKALDDRMGCVAMVETIRSLVKNPPALNADIFFCFTVREEIGLSGAKVAANEIAPDFALVLETTAVGDIADTAPNSRVADLGHGGVLSIMDRSTIYDRRFVDFALSCAQKEGIDAQIKRYVSGGNDAGHIHKTRAGVRCLALSVPTRYLHSPSCVARIHDYTAVRDLCEAIVRNFDLLARN